MVPAASDRVCSTRADTCYRRATTVHRRCADRASRITLHTRGEAAARSAVIAGACVCYQAHVIATARDLERQPTPERIVDDGHVHVGRFDRPFRTVNLDEAPAHHLLARLRGGPLGRVERAWRKLRLKQWHYASVATPRLFLGAVVFDAGYVGVGFAYVVDRKTGHMREWSKTVPLARGIAIAPNSTDGVSRFTAAGFGTIEFDNDGASGSRTLRIRIEDREGAPGLDVDYAMRERPGEIEPVIAVGEPEPGRWLYTHKAYGLPAGGTIATGDWNESVSVGDALAGLDWNRGYRLTETYWNWAAAAGRDTRGRTIGFTFTSHVPVGGAAEAPPDTANDSAMWLNGRVVDLDALTFTYDPADLLLPWRIKDARGLVDLEFQPLGERVEDVDLKLIVSRFHQPYGTFRGTLRTTTGEIFPIADVFGVTEQHFARW